MTSLEPREFRRAAELRPSQPQGSYRAGFWRGVLVGWSMSFLGFMLILALIVFPVGK